MTASSPDDRIHELFTAALERPVDERDAFLAEATAGDVELLAAVGELLEGAREAFAEVARSLSDGDLALRPAGLAGETLDDFELVEEIGRGGAGIVYRARQRIAGRAGDGTAGRAGDGSTGREVAVKVLAPLPGDDLRRSAERFKREAIAASRLRHPAIVPIFYYGHAAGHDYYAMELVRGPSLRDHLDDLAALPPDQAPAQAPDLRQPHEAARLIAQLARGLDYSHGLQIIHRDVKPQNVLIDVDGRPRLTDFGLAKNLELGGFTLPGDLAGTPHYMAPEQAVRALGPIDARTDVYSLGAVLYEILCGRPPADGETLTDVLLAITERRVADVERIGSGIPHQLGLVCMKALRHDPDKRYQSAGDFARDLESFMEGRRVDARPPTVVERLQARTVDRRSLLRALPAAALLGALGATGGAAALRHWSVGARDPRLVWTGDRPATLALTPVDGELCPRATAVELGRLAPGDTRACGERGFVRIAAVDDAGSRIDVVRELYDDAVVELAPSFELRGGPLVAVPGGPVTVMGFGAGGAAGPATHVVEDFELDAAAVSNADFRAFLAATGREALPYWTPAWVATWREPPRDDWDELPVVDVSWDDAEAYANWAGKRLPSRLELTRAALHDESWLEGLDVLASEAFVLGRAPRPTGLSGTPMSAAYAIYVEPARAAHRNGSPGGRFHHLTGNVAEWTATPFTLAATGAGGPARFDGERYLRAGAWHWPEARKLSADAFRLVGRKHQAGHSADIGFRCARSALA